MTVVPPEPDPHPAPGDIPQSPVIDADEPDPDQPTDDGPEENRDVDRRRGAGESSGSPSGDRQ